MAEKTQAVAERPDRAALVGTMKRIEEIQKNHQVAFTAASSEAERSLVLACSLIDLRQAIKPFALVLKQLQGSKLGFRTDKDREGGYGDAVLIDCAIEASIRGARWTGNEFNIIAGGCYLTKEYWWRMVREIDGIADLDMSADPPTIENQKVIVRFEATWTLHGKPGVMDRKFSIIVRSGQSDDATLGKAEARMLKAIHKRLTGTSISDADDDEPRVQARPAPSRPAIDHRPANPSRCDGNHAGEPCGDPECWQLDISDRFPQPDHPGRLFDAPVQDVGAIK
jgi:hypothetical protein